MLGYYTQVKSMYGRKRSGSTKGKAVTKKSKGAPKVPYAKPRFTIMRNPYSPSISNTLRTTHRYQDNFTVTGSLGASGVYVFSANGLYDPNITGAGHQPAGYDEMQALFADYVVVGFTAKLIAKNTNTTASALFGMYICKTSTTYTSLQRYAENGSGYYKAAGASNLTNDMVELYCKGDMNQLIGDNVLQDPQMYGDGSRNPTEGRFIHVTVSSFDVTSSISSAQCNIEIVYDVVWRDKLVTNVS